MAVSGKIVIGILSTTAQQGGFREGNIISHTYKQTPGRYIKYARTAGEGGRKKTASKKGGKNPSCPA
jgi:hypothetical protein